MRHLRLRSWQNEYLSIRMPVNKDASAKRRRRAMLDLLQRFCTQSAITSKLQRKASHNALRTAGVCQRYFKHSEEERQVARTSTLEEGHRITNQLTGCYRTALLETRGVGDAGQPQPIVTARREALRQSRRATRQANQDKLYRALREPRRAVALQGSKRAAESHELDSYIVTGTSEL